MAVKSLRVSLRFANGSNAVVKITADRVLANLYGILEFSGPPITREALQAGNETYTIALSAMASGGKLATAHKNAARLVVVDMLRSLALFVQMRSAGNLPLLLSSGFEAVSTNRAQVPLPRPYIIRITAGRSGETILAATANDNIHSWQPQFALVDEDGTQGEWMNDEPCTNSRAIPISGLIPGRLYAFRVRSVGGSNGTSDWSVAMIHRAN